MEVEEYFYNCSREYVSAISPELPSEILSILTILPVRKTQAEINNDLFWLLTQKEWAFDTLGLISAASPRDWDCWTTVVTGSRKGTTGP
jgi:hypothetical protein